jgi:ABC-type glycerol-3-phosphate transport system substrate-binding protein
MKKILSVLAILALAFSLNAQKITFLHGGDIEFANGDSLFRHALAQLKKDFPSVEVDMMKVDLSSGSTMTMDALLAAGRAPNVYMDFIGRVSKYLVPEYALDLKANVRDIGKYLPSALAPYTRGGHVLGLPSPGGAQGMAINLDLMKEIGFEVKPDWMISDFLRMAELVKKHYGGKKWATGMFAANQSGDYLINNWFAAFGAQFYTGGNYGKTAIAQTGGEKVYAFFQTLASKGYIPPGAATLTDDDYVIQWAKGDIAATAFFPGWTDPYFKTVIDQGLIQKPFNYKFVAFPRIDGGKAVPTYISSAAFVVRKTGTAVDQVAARLVEYLNDAYNQGNQAIAQKTVPNRSDVKVESKDARFLETVAIAKFNGIFDVGLTIPTFSAIRATGYPILQKVLNLQITPGQAIKEYEAKINEAINY